MTAIDVAAADKLLTTTRSVRARLDLTRPVPPELIEECLEIAVQAPQESGNCRYHFVVVTDADKRAHLAELYRRAFPTFYTPEQLEQLRQTQARPRVLEGPVGAHAGRSRAAPPLCRRAAGRPLARALERPVRQHPPDSV